MRPSVVKAKLRRNETALITCLHLTDPSLHELVSLMGFDGIWMDMEHHGYSVEKAIELLSQDNPQAAVSIEALIAFIAEKYRRRIKGRLICILWKQLSEPRLI